MDLTFANQHPELTFVPLLIHMVPMDTNTHTSGLISAFVSINNPLSDILAYAKESSKPIPVTKDQYLLLLTEESSIGSGIIWRHLELLNHFYEEHYQIHLDLFWGYACPLEQLTIQCNYLSKQAQTMRRNQTPCHRQFVVHEAIEYLLEDPAQSCDELAEQLALHPDYLMNVFKEETGQSLGDFIAMLRIKEARKLLQHTSISIAEIAARSSYYNVSYFNRIFKEKTGMTPREYRRKYQKAGKGKQRLIFSDMGQRKQNQA